MLNDSIYVMDVQCVYVKYLFVIPDNTTLGVEACRYIMQHVVLINVVLCFKPCVICCMVNIMECVIVCNLQLSIVCSYRWNIETYNAMQCSICSIVNTSFITLSHNVLTYNLF